MCVCLYRWRKLVLPLVFTVAEGDERTSFPFTGGNGADPALFSVGGDWRYRNCAGVSIFVKKQEQGQRRSQLSLWVAPGVTGRAL